jgi:outer membrane protein
MNKFLLGLNGILIGAVGFLFYKQYSSPNSKVAPKQVVSSKTDISAAASQLPIAFVDLDSLNEKIVFIKNRREELEREQKNIEVEWRNGYAGLENKKNNFMKKGASITQQEAEKMQNELMREQQIIDERKQNLNQALSEKSFKFLEDTQKKLKDYLADYNKDNKYQFILTVGSGMDYMLYKNEDNNITAEVIDGMNKLLGK